MAALSLLACLLALPGAASATQEIPRPLERINALDNPTIDIDSIDDKRVDVDVAVLDTGVDLDHPDLVVVESTNCANANPGCVNGQGDDTSGHGTTVAGALGALDNDIGTVGVAPGARLWAVRVGSSPLAVDISDLIAGIDWVADHADEIEIAHMSLIADASATTQERADLQQAIDDATAEGVVFVAAASNNQRDIADPPAIIPASLNNVIAVSALADFDGQHGGTGVIGDAPSGCTFTEEQDDTIARFSNYGADIDMIAPGVCVRTSFIGGGYILTSGTSLAAPLVSGAAALLASADNPDDAGDVDDIRETLRTRGNTAFKINGGWDDGDYGDPKEPLLDVSNSTDFAPEMDSIAEPIGVFAPTSGWVSVFVLDRATNTIKQRVWNQQSNTWSDWGDLGSPPGGAVSEPSVVARPYGSSDARDIFVRGADGALWQRSKASAAAAWGSWTAITASGGTGSGVTAVSPSADRIHLFVRTAANVVYEGVWTPGGGWVVTALPDGANITGLSAVSLYEGYITLFGRDANGDIKRRVWHQSTGWGSWVNHGRPPGGTTSEPVAVGRPHGSTQDRDVFVSGANGTLWRSSANLTTGVWTNWTQVGQQGLTSAPTAVSPAADTIHLLGRTGVTYAFHRSIWTAPTGWTSWAPIG